MIAALQSQNVSSPLTGNTQLGAFAFTARSWKRQWSLLEPQFEQVNVNFDSHQTNGDTPVFSGLVPGWSGGELIYVSTGAYQITNRSYSGPLIPYFTAIASFKTHPTSVSDVAVSQVGVWSKTVANKYLVATINHASSGSSAQINYALGGQEFGTGNVVFTPAPPYELALVVNATFAHIFYRNIDASTNAPTKGWFRLTSVNIPSAIDFRDPAILADMAYAWGFNGGEAGVVWTVNGFRAGHFGMMGGIGYVPITYEDGTPIRDGPWIYVTVDYDGLGTHTGGTDGRNVAACHWGVAKLHQDTGEIVNVSKIGFKRLSSGATKVLGDNDGHLVFDRTIGAWRVLVTPWGDTNDATGGYAKNTSSNGQLYYGTTKENLLQGVHVLSLTQTNITNPTPPSPGVGCQDPCFVQVNGVWQMMCNVGTDLCLFSTVDFVNFTLLARNQSVPVYHEGPRIVKVGGTWLYLAAATNGEYTMFDATLTRTGAINCPVPPSLVAPHPSVLPVFRDGQTFYQLVTFNYAVYNTFDWSNGDLFVYETTTSNAGFEFNVPPLLVTAV